MFNEKNTKLISSASSKGPNQRANNNDEPKNDAFNESIQLEIFIK